MIRGAGSWPSLVLVAAVLAGCVGRPGLDPGSRTQGVELDLWLRGEENLAIYYEVAQEGTIGFGGGADGRQRRISWTGPLTDDEIERLRELLQRDGWYTGDVVATGEPRKREVRIHLCWPGGGKRYKLRGESPDIAPVLDLLEEASRRRLEGTLRELPQPSKPGE
jgi:hypothetical protein